MYDSKKVTENLIGGFSTLLVHGLTQYSIFHMMHIFQSWILAHTVWTVGKTASQDFT